MEQMMRRSAALLLALILSVVLALPAAAAEEDVVGQAAYDAAAGAMTYGDAVSVQYALWHDGEIIASGQQGVYSKTENRLLTADNLYGVGSVSKIYTTVAMMKLVDDGKVDLDAPVKRYLPEFTMADSRYKDITVRMLLNHSSGLMGTTSLNAFLLNDGDNDGAVDGLLEQLKTQTLQADPGAYSVYCNDGFTLAQLVIERVSGMPFEDFLRQEIAEPLGLDATFAPQDDFDQSLLAKTYIGQSTQALPPETLPIVGAGGIYASAEDLAAFGGALCGTDLLSETSLDAMENAECLRGLWPEDSEGSLLSYGLGWDAVSLYPFSGAGIQALVKGGDTLSYHCGLIVLPEYDMAAAVLTSGGISSYNEMAAASMLIAALAAEGVTVDVSTAVLDEAAAAAMPEALTACSGDYGSSTGLAQITVTKDGALSLTMAGMEEPMTFTYRQDGTFRDEGNTVALRLTEEDGHVYLQQIAYTGLPGLAPFYSAEYIYEKLPQPVADETTMAAWEAREGKIYAQINEVYTSALYPFGAVFGAVSLVGSPEGYLSINRLEDGNTAAPVLQIPGVGSRDSGVIEMVADENGVEYMTMNGAVYQDTDSFSPIYGGARSHCTIPSSGYARWYDVGESSGKTMTVTVPEGGGFCVYDGSLQAVAASWAYGTTTVELPENGFVVFAGAAGTVFSVTMA